MQILVARSKTNVTCHSQQERMLGRTQSTISTHKLIQNILMLLGGHGATQCHSLC